MALTKAEHYQKYISNPENAARKKAKLAEWRKNNAERIRQTRKAYNSDPINQARANETWKAWSEKNPDKVKEYEAKSRQNKSDSGYKAAYDKQYRENPVNKAKRREYLNRRFSEDPKYKSIHLIRTLLIYFVKKCKNLNKFSKQIGCTKAELISHIEGQFKDGMNWNNHGKWHIDHIKALTLFDLDDKEQHKIASHYTNLQPLWATENIKKRNK